MSYLTQIALMASLMLPTVALGAGSGSDSPPPATQTTTKCKKTEVWDEKTKKCVDAQTGAETGQLDNDTLYQAARELAYAGRPDDALVVLSVMSEGQTDRVLTYMGFANRKAGRIEEGMNYYLAALEKNPDNILARSYMGQGLVEQGKIELAKAQLDEIIARGGKGTWPEKSLRQAIESGETYSY